MARRASATRGTGAGDTAGCGDDRLDRQGRVLIRFADRPDGFRQRQQRAEELGGILGLFHADDQMRRPVGPTAQVFGQDDAGAGVVAAVQPKFPIRRQQIGQTAVQALQPRGPFGAGQAGGIVRQAGGAQGGDARCRRCPAGTGRAGRASALRCCRMRRCSGSRRLAAAMSQSRPRSLTGAFSAAAWSSRMRRTSSGWAPMATGTCRLHDPGFFRRR